MYCLLASFTAVRIHRLILWIREHLDLSWLPMAVGEERVVISKSGGVRDTEIEIAIILCKLTKFKSCK